MVYDPHMRDEAQRRGVMVQLARCGLDHDQIIPITSPS
jgi:hypothetical protein